MVTLKQYKTLKSAAKFLSKSVLMSANETCTQIDEKPLIHAVASYTFCIKRIKPVFSSHKEKKLYWLMSTKSYTFTSRSNGNWTPFAWKT